MVRELGMEVCCGGIVGMGETLAQRAEFAAQLAAIAPDEVPLNFLDPRPGRRSRTAGRWRARTRCARWRRSGSRCRAPSCVRRRPGDHARRLRYRAGLLGGINAVIVGNYLTTLGRPAAEDLELLDRLSMPVKALSSTL